MFYVFHGDDPHSQRETVAELAGRLGDPAMVELNTNRFSGKGLTLAELRYACDSVPFLAEKRLIIVSDLMAEEPPFLDELLAYLPHLPESTRLVFLESRPLAVNHPLLKLAEQSPTGFVKAFNRPEGSILERWIRKQVGSSGGDISPRAAHLLAINVGNDLGILANEIEKLVLYKGRDPIEAEDVSKLCPHVAEASIFDLVDASGNRNGKIAANLLNAKLREGTDPSYLFAMFVRQFRLLIQIKELLEQGVDPQKMASELKLHGFVVGKLRQQCQNFTLDQLEEIYGHLLEVDVRVKTGRTDLITALSLLIAGIAA